jgi:hypothetical protein
VSETMYQRTLVLADEAGVDRVREVALREGWSVGYACPAGHTQQAEIIWEVVGRGEDRTVVNYVEEHHSGDRLVAAIGPNTDAVEATAAILATSLPAVAEDALLASLLEAETEDPREVVRKLRTMAAFSHIGYRTDAEIPPVDPRHRAVLERHLAYPHRQVRLTAILVADQLSHLWPELMQPVLARKGSEVELDHLVDMYIAAGEGA